MKVLSLHIPKNLRNDLIQCIAWFILLVSPLFIFTMATTSHRVIFHLLLLILGWLCWTITEYCVHRFADHGEPTHLGEKKERLHHYHHKHPTELAISPLHRAGLFILCSGLILFAIWFDNYFTMLPGFILGFTSYTFTHWLLHHKISARLFPQLHRFHIHHHCKHPDKCFGVTVTWWDHLFGTVPKNEKKISDRILGFYYKKGKKTVSLNNMMDEKIQLTKKQSA